MENYSSEEFVSQEFKIKMVDASEFKEAPAKRFSWQRFKKILFAENNSALYSGSYSSFHVSKLPWYQIVVNKRWNIFKIFWASALLNLVIISFISRAETLPSGVSGVPTLLMFIFPNLKPFFGLFFLLMNAPILIYYQKKIKKDFVILNWCYLFFSLFWSSVLNIGDINDFVLSITDIAGGWSLDKLSENSQMQTVPILIYGSIGAIFSGLNYAFLWSSGSSTAGTDIISYYYSVKKQQNVGSLLRIFSIGTTLIYFLFYVAVFWNKTTNGTPGDTSSGILRRHLFAIQFLTTIITIIVSTAIVNILYPKYKKVNLEIITQEPGIVVSFFNRIDYWHSYRIETFKSGMTKNDKKQISTVVFYHEAKDLIRDLQNFDPDLWIKMVEVKKIWGRFDSSRVD